jgi:hypothetical protein
MIRLTPDCPTLSGRADRDELLVSDWVRKVVDDAALQITVRVIHKLEPQVQPTPKRAPLQLFLSHAKVDLSPDTMDPVRFVENDVNELAIDCWFDAAEIPPSADLGCEIAKGIRDCSVVVSFLTDHYSSRSWCQREVLDAKRLGVPVLVVDALDEGEPRHFPYIGNVPVVHWRADDPRLEARRVVSHTARETLRYIHNRAKLARHADGTGTTALAVAPEALTLAHCCSQSANRTFVYPDPPLGRQELSVLRTLVADAEFTTPLTMLAQSTRLDGRIVAVSISNSEDLATHGLTEFHEQTLADEICLYLLLTGCRIAYGGILDTQIHSASNFTLRLFEIVRAYSSLALAATGKGLHPIVNYAPWPLRLSYDDQILSLFGDVATLTEGARPAEIPEEDNVLFARAPGGAWIFASDTPLRRLAWARGLTAMRTQMTQEVSARVVIGGRAEKFAGIYPGVIEEAWLALVAGRPLFLCGAFGGVSRLLIDAIATGTPDAVLACMQTAEISKSIEIARARGLSLVDARTSQNGLPDSQTLVLGEKMALDFSVVGKDGVAATLKNGLSDEENEQLFYASEPEEIARLVLSGLSKVTAI